MRAGHEPEETTARAPGAVCAEGAGTRRWFVVDLGGPHRTLGWTVVGGGIGGASAVAWLAVRDDELAPPVDPAAFARAALAAERLATMPVFLTSCDLESRVEETASAGGVDARCVATVGLGNRGRVGEPAAPAVHAGTINLLCVTSEPLTEPALVEAISIASSARTAAVLQAGLALPGSDRLATGTGTDCCIVASPLDRARPELAYAGLHTAVGEAIGRAAFVATARGVARWLAAHGDQRRARA
ncbi:MAG TPA: adenosylcobinamide amidohydrolase [Candidatus Binatia bacterium]|nr:adenosylcobinamide amidohydrolase [Candidatus Binatia bacterium]